MTGRGAEAHGDLLAGKWHSMWWFDWSPTRKLRERFHVCLVYMRVLKISVKLLKLLEHSVHIQSPKPQEERKWQTPPRPCIFQWANTSQQVMPLNIFPYWHGFCCVATQKRDWDNTICVLVFIFLWKHMSVVELPFFSILYLQMGALFKCNHATVSVPLHCDCLW